MRGIVFILTWYVFCYWSEQQNRSRFKGRFEYNLSFSYGPFLSWHGKDASSMIIYTGNFATLCLFLLSQRTIWTIKNDLESVSLGSFLVSTSHRYYLKINQCSPLHLAPFHLFLNLFYPASWVSFMFWVIIWFFIEN